MKLIKQNDSAGGLIFKQNNNGKAMKQNYNFGKAFKFSGSIRASSDFSHLMTNGFSFLVWGRNWQGSSNANSFFTLTFDNTIIVEFSPRGNPSFSLQLRIRDPILGTINNFNVGPHENTSFLAGLVNNTVLYNNNKSPVWSGGALPDNYFIGKTLTKVSFPNAQLSGLINDIIIYDRNIADAEVSYFFNNKLGNEELNDLGLIAKYKNDAATIVDNSVVIKNYAGVENLELLNLPAGTLEEQRDYANDNLFETW